MSYPSDELKDDIDALTTGAHRLSEAANAIATITSGSDVVVENFDHLEEVLDNLQAFFDTLKGSTFYPPVGSISPFAGASAYAPPGWLLCQGTAGTAVTSASFPDLYNVLTANGTVFPYGGSAGTTYTPDLRGRVVAGVDFNNSDTSRLYTANNNAATLGQVIGDYRLQEHTHTYSGTTGSGDWLAAYNHYGPLGGSSAYPVSTSEANGRTIQGAGGGHTHSFSGTTNNHNKSQGSAQNVQPTIMLNYIIFAGKV